METGATRNRIVVGHHGTTSDQGTQILADGVFRPSINKYDWLGYGSYFFEYSFFLAKLWAAREHEDDEVCVVEADIALQHCLNLADGRGPILLRPFYGRCISIEGRESIAALKQNSAKQKTREGYRDFDCKVINLACDYFALHGREIHVVRGVFDEGDWIYTDPKDELPSSRLRMESHIQLAVRSPAAVLAIRPGQADEEP